VGAGLTSAPMRRIAALLALLALCALAAGCGGHNDKDVTPLDDAVGYFAKDAPFVMAIETDPDGPQVKQLRELVGRFPGSDLLATRVQALVHLPFLRYDRDVQPQLGAPLVVGLVRPAAGGGLSTATVVAMRVKHPTRAKQVLLRQPGFRGSSKSSGVRIYENPPERRYAAVDGDVVVAATDRGILEQALAMRRNQNRMRESGFLRDLKGLPDGGLIRVSADPKAMLGADQRLRPALAVKWIASLRRLGAVVKTADTGITLDLHAVTDKGSISDADLPLAPKPGPLPLIGRRGELQVGIREPSRLARLAFQVAHAIAPRRMALLKALEPAGIDLERQLPHHLGDKAVVAYDPVGQGFAARAALNEPADVKVALAQLTPALPAVASLFGIKGLGVATPESGERFYALAKPNGRTAVFGVVGGTLVVADQARRVAGLASEATHEAPGGVTGAAIVTLDARALAGKLLAKELGGPAALLAPLAVASLRDLTGALTISQDGLRGQFTLTIVK
jgi:Protein of unknown function (DUF3352)